MLPVRARNVLPPVAEVPQVHRTRRLAEDERAGDERFRIRAGEVSGVERALAEGDVARFADEPAKVGGGDGVLVHPEPVQRDAMHRPFLGVEVFGSHLERALGDPAHLVGQVAHVEAEILSTPGLRRHHPDRRIVH